MVERADWAGLLAGCRTSVAEVRLRAPLRATLVGRSGAFLGLADDDRRYWIKTLNNLQGPRTVVTEQIIGHAGSLIGAATCDVRTIEISPDLAGWDFRHGTKL